VTRGASVLLALLVAAAGGGERRPTAALSPAGALTITLPAELMRSPEVKQQLTSGLTTVFVVDVSAEDGQRTTKGGARVEIRFELWEEKYLLSLIDATGQERKLTFASEEGLRQWWSESPLTVTPPYPYGRRVEVKVKLTMLPFSSQEQSDTQRWLSRTLSASGARDAEPSPAQSAELLRIIVQSSTRRRPLLERQWSARAER
jgi:hypothetical protein